MFNNKLGTANTWGHKRNPDDSKCTPFGLFEVENCRESMLNLTDASNSEVENNAIRRNKHEHLRNGFESDASTFLSINKMKFIFTIVLR